MTDKEKIAEIIKKNGTYNGRSLSFDYYVVQPDDLATALIENGIGDIIGWKRRAEVAERPLYCLARSFAEAMCKDGDTHHLIEGFIKDAYRQAKGEFAEEKKDD